MQTQFLIRLALFIGLFFIIWLARYYRKSYQTKTASLLAGSQVYPTALGPVEASIQGEGPVVSIFHGGGGGYDRGQVYAHPEWGYKYITLSRPGYLRTPLSVGKTPAQQADALAALMDTLEIEKTVVMGVSAGGPSAIEFSLRYPERCSALILSSAVNHPLHPIKVLLYSVGKYIIPFNLITWFFLNRVGLFSIRPNLALQLLGDSQKQARIKNLIASLWPSRPRFEGMNNDFENIQQGLTHSLSDISRPTLVIHGTADMIISHHQGRQAADEIPNAEFLSIKGGTHFCMISHAEIAHPVLIEFLNKYTN